MPTKPCKIFYPCFPPPLDGPDPLPGVTFVFGSNLAGRHGKGAAEFARTHYGAEYGTGRGWTGKSFAVPTKNEELRPLSFKEVAVEIAQFLGEAWVHEVRALTPLLSDDGLTRLSPMLPWLLVTRIGCGLAGFTDAHIAPLFADAPPCCILPRAWEPFIAQWRRQRGHEVEKWLACRIWHDREGEPVK